MSEADALSYESSRWNGLKTSCSFRWRILRRNGLELVSVRELNLEFLVGWAAAEADLIEGLELPWVFLVMGAVRH